MLLTIATLLATWVGTIDRNNFRLTIATILATWVGTIDRNNFRHAIQGARHAEVPQVVFGFRRSWAMKELLAGRRLEGTNFRRCNPRSQARRSSTSSLWLQRVLGDERIVGWTEARGNQGGRYMFVPACKALASRVDSRFKIQKNFLNPESWIQDSRFSGAFLESRSRIQDSRVKIQKELLESRPWPRLSGGKKWDSRSSFWILNLESRTLDSRSSFWILNLES